MNKLTIGIVIILFAVISNCSYHKTEENNIVTYKGLYYLWFKDIVQSVYTLSQNNPENIYSYGIANEDEIKSFRKILQKEDARLLMEFTGTDTLLFISYFKAKLELPSKVELYITGLNTFYQEYVRKNDYDSLSSEFKKFVLQKSKLSIVPNLIKTRNLEKKEINGKKYSASVAFINKQELINFNVYGAFFSRNLSEKEIEFLNFADSIYNNILHGDIRNKTGDE